MLICNVVGARPNFMKMAPVVLEIERRGLPQILVHTGQHYDDEMSRVFFDELGLPAPAVQLGIGSDTHARQTGRMLIALEQVYEEQKPDMVVVAGDVNSTLAAGLAAAKLGIPVSHVEAGLRSFDRTMPEEINRILTDHLSSLLFTTEECANRNLRREGVAAERVHFVGNCMVDSLLRFRDGAVRRRPWREFGVPENGYALVTLHRPSNVDDGRKLAGLLKVLEEIAGSVPVLFPVHPRTRERIRALPQPVVSRVQFAPPMGYLEFLGLMARAAVVLTDSGGIQEETSVLGVPCVTVRENTERPVTVELGTNVVVGTDPERVKEAALAAISRGPRVSPPPPLWDGRAAERVVTVIARYLGLTD